MKKVINIFLIVFVFSFVGVINVSAINISANESVTAGKNISVKFTDAVASKVSDPNYEFSYNNQDKVEKTSSNGINGIDNISFNGTTGEIFFSTKEVGSDYTVTFEIKDKNNNEIKSAKVLVKSTKVQSTTPTTNTSATTITTAPTTTTQKKSDNAFLKSLEVKADDGSLVKLSPEFKKDVYVYSANVSSTIKKVEINATMEDTKSVVVFGGMHGKELKAGENNKITLTVTAESKKIIEYVINIKRDALTTDATLKELIIKEKTQFKLEQGKYIYSINIDKNIEKLDITAVTNDANAVTSITGNEKLENGSKIKILVTAPDGTKKEYVLNIIKEVKTTTKKVEVREDNTNRNPLIIMALSLIGFSIIGSIIYVAKK